MSYTGTSTADGRRQVETPKGAIIFMLGAVALLWVLEIIDTVTLHLLDQFGIRPWEPSGLIGILFAPFLHFGFAHLIANSGPLFILGVLILLGRGGVQRLFASTSISALFSGLAAWVLTPIHSLVLGASGVVFGWLTYLIARGFYARDWKSIGVSVLVLAVYGSVLFGVLPTASGVSWQAHLGGAIGGIVAAWLTHKRAARRPVV